MGLFRFEFNRSVIMRILISLGLFLTTGCVDAAAYGMATPTPTPSPICSPNGNFYMSNDGAIGIQSQKAMGFANDIYSRYLNNPSDLGLARSEAIDFLAFETRRWSHYENIKLDDNNSVQVMMTFISPELIRAVLLNHALFNISQSPLSGSNLTDFSNNILSTMDNQKKYLFLIAIQPVTNNQSTTSFQIPSSHIVLINNSGMHVTVINNDNFLDQTFNLLSKLHAGFLFYPFGNLNGGECQRVLDPLRDTSITLSIEAQFASVQKTITWEILFAPPLQVSGAIPTPNPNMILPDSAKKPLEDLPGDLPIPESSQSKDIAYWRPWGQFVWGKLTYDLFSSP